MALTHHTMLAVIVLAAFSSAPAWADEDTLEVQRQGSISYVSGGIGEDETAALKATQRNYNLRVMNVDKSGHFSDEARIVISDTKGNALLDVPSGPLFYASLPKGRYVVEGISGDQRRKQTVTITGNTSQQLRFIWLQNNNAND